MSLVFSFLRLVRLNRAFGNRAFQIARFVLARFNRAFGNRAFQSVRAPQGRRVSRFKPRVWVAFQNRAFEPQRFRVSRVSLRPLCGKTRVWGLRLELRFRIARLGLAFQGALRSVVKGALVILGEPS